MKGRQGFSASYAHPCILRRGYAPGQFAEFVPLALPNPKRQQVFKNSAASYCNDEGVAQKQSASIYSQQLLSMRTGIVVEVSFVNACESL